MASYSDIEDAKAHLQQEQEAYLHIHGWSLTCNIPGSLWMWVRDFTEEDAERHRRWNEVGPGPYGWPSEPKPHGQITASLEQAVHITRSVLDRTVDDEIERAFEASDAE